LDCPSEIDHCDVLVLGRSRYAAHYIVRTAVMAVLGAIDAMIYGTAPPRKSATPLLTAQQRYGRSQRGFPDVLVPANPQIISSSRME